MRTNMARWARVVWLPLGSMLLQGCGFTLWFGGRGVGGGDGQDPPEDRLIVDPDELELRDDVIRPDDLINPDDRLNFGG